MMMMTIMIMTIKEDEDDDKDKQINNSLCQSKQYFLRFANGTYFQIIIFDINIFRKKR